MRAHPPARNRSKSRSLVFTLALLVCATFALARPTAAARPPQGTTPPPGAAPPVQSRAPVTKENALSFLRGVAPERRELSNAFLAAAVRDSGVDFEVTPAVEQELLAAGATPDLIAAARANFRPQGSAASQGAQRGGGPAPAATPSERDAALLDGPPSVTKHEIRVGSRSLRYTVTTGVMPLKSVAGETEARIFYMAYTLDDAGARRAAPADVLLQRRAGVVVRLAPPRRARAPPRARCWTTARCRRRPSGSSTTSRRGSTSTDLVFIDPVGTGYSRAAKPELAKPYFGLQGDIESVGEFIRLYLVAQQPLDFAALPRRRKLRDDARRRALRLPHRARHRLQRRAARLDHPELPDGALRARATTCPTSSSSRPTRPPPGITSGSPPTCRVAGCDRSSTRSSAGPRPTTPSRWRRATSSLRPSGRRSSTGSPATRGSARPLSTTATSASRFSASTRSCCATRSAPSAASTAASKGSTTSPSPSGRTSTRA